MVDAAIPKALTLKAPWAWAVAHAGKRIENRSWTTNYRGTLYIHAGSSDLHADRQLVSRICGDSLPAEIARGQIVAVATLVDVLPYRKVKHDTWAMGPWCWILQDVTVLARPRTMSGRLGLWPAPYTIRSTQKGRS